MARGGGSKQKNPRCSSRTVSAAAACSGCGDDGDDPLPLPLLAAAAVLLGPRPPGRRHPPTAPPAPIFCRLLPAALPGFQPLWCSIGACSSWVLIAAGVRAGVLLPRRRKVTELLRHLLLPARNEELRLRPPAILVPRRYQHRTQAGARGAPPCLPSPHAPLKRWSRRLVARQSLSPQQR